MSDTIAIELREPGCSECGSKSGIYRISGVQRPVYCAKCAKYQNYNAALSKVETGGDGMVARVKGREMTFDDLERTAPRGAVNVAGYGEFLGLVLTESGGTIHFAGGDVTLSTEQAFALLRQQR